MKVKDFVFEVFLRLTSRTVPYCEEDRLMEEVFNLFPEDIEKDLHGNYFYKVGDSRTIFASHLDTVCNKYETVTHVFDGDIIRTDGKTTLGADDKAGVTVMLWMIKNKVPGLYYFFIGEEVGCIGSGLAAKYGDFKGSYDRIISFDRRGTGSVITHQSCGRSCSDSFADDLCRELNRSGMKYEKDTGGVYTDSAEFVDIIPECTNISVGYYKEHTMSEHQDITHLTKLAKACVLVNWESLSTSRKPGTYEAKPYSGYNWRHEYEYNSSSSSKRSYGDNDDWYDEVDPEWHWNGFDYVRKKKTRRGGKGKKNRINQFDNSRVYYDSGDDLIDITDYKLDNRIIGNVEFTDETKYDWLLDKFMESRLNIDELEKIKDQYFDDSDYDKMFYQFLKEKIV